MKKISYTFEIVVPDDYYERKKIPWYMLPKDMEKMFMTETNGQVIRVAKSEMHVVDTES